MVFLTPLTTGAWNNFGHMEVACAAYRKLTPRAKTRVNTLVKLNPKFTEWSSLIPASASQADKDMMLFMLAATWPDEIKSDTNYVKDGSANGNRPEGSPNSGANTGYGDNLMHKYWHFIDTPFSTDGTPLPSVPTPNAQERIALFRGVLASGSPDPLKSYDLCWLLHLVGDVHQPLHCVTRVTSTDTNGDDGGNGVKLSCSGCPSNLHSFWDDALGSRSTRKAAIKPAITAAKRLAAADPSLAAKSDGKDWIAESFQAAKSAVYVSPVGAGSGPFSLTAKYKRAAKKLAKQRVELAGERLANLLNTELN
jgi:hypothetical protein